MVLYSIGRFRRTVQFAYINIQ